MASENRVFLIGNTGGDPESFETKNGPGAKFSVATHEGKEGDETVWHRIVVFGRQAESCLDFLKKGRLVRVEGRLRYNKFRGAGGTEHERAEIIADRVLFLEKPYADNGGASPPAAGTGARTRSSDADNGGASSPAARTGTHTRSDCADNGGASPRPAGHAAPPLGTGTGARSQDSDHSDTLPETERGRGASRGDRSDREPNSRRRATGGES